MSRLKVSLATAVNERTRPLIDGSVEPDGVELIPLVSHASETFWRQLRFGDFDVCEMSLSSHIGSWTKLVPVFPDPIAEGRRLFRARGYIPINHTYVIRGDLARRHPWLALNVYKAFLEAKRLAEQRLIDAIPVSLVFRWEYLSQTKRYFGDDPFPYGVSANRRPLQDLIGYSAEQGLISAAFPVDTLFAPSTIEWE